MVCYRGRGGALPLQNPVNPGKTLCDFLRKYGARNFYDDAVKRRIINTERTEDTEEKGRGKALRAAKNLCDLCVLCVENLFF